MKNITDLYENGTICINPIKFFKQIEYNKLRGDNYEGASKIINSLSRTLESLEATVILNTKKFIPEKKQHFGLCSGVPTYPI